MNTPLDQLLHRINARLEQLSQEIDERKARYAELTAFRGSVADVRDAMKKQPTSILPAKAAS